MMKIEQKQTADQAPLEIPELFTFDHNHKPVRVEMIDGEPWFVAKDVCDALSLTDTGKTVERLDDDEKLIRTLFVSGQNRELWTVNESGLYNLIFQSRKPEARAFRKWVTSVLLPVLRKTGKYAPGEVENDCPYTNPPVRPDELFSSGKIVKCMMELMNDVCYVDNGDLRINMAAKLMTVYNSM